MQAVVVEEVLAAARGAPAVRVARLQSRLTVCAELVQANAALGLLSSCSATMPELRQLPPPPSPTSIPAYRTASAPAAEEGSGGGGGGGGVVRSVVSLSASLRA